MLALGLGVHCLVTKKPPGQILEHFLDREKVILTVAVSMHSYVSGYDLSKLRDFIDQQADAYVGKGILDQEEADVIKRIYGSL